MISGLVIDVWSYKSKLLIVCLLLFSLSDSHADFNSNNSSGKSLAEGINQGISQQAEDPDMSNIPHYDEEGVSERNYYDRGIAIEEDAIIHAQDDDTALFVNNSRNIRPNFEIDKENDPLFKREEEIVDLSRSLTETYDGCVQLPVGTDDITTIEDRQCHVFGSQNIVNFRCDRYLEVNCSNSDAWQPDPYHLSDFNLSGIDDPAIQEGDSFSFGSRVNNRSGSCSRYTRMIRFYVPSKILITNFRINEIIYDDWLDIRINHRLVFRAIGGSIGTHLTGNFSCEHSRVWSAEGFDAISYLRNGWNTIVMSNLVHDRGNMFINMTLHRIKSCHVSKSFRYDCEGHENHLNGQLISRVCVDSGYKDVNGRPFFEPCWQWSERYTRKEKPVYHREALCDQIESEGCGQVAAECIVNGDGFCLQEQLRYQCEHVNAARHTGLCGDILVCADGSCAEEYQEQKDVQDDFRRAATGLAIAEEISKEFNHNNLTIFTGQPRTCQQKSFGFSNCCQDSGWGVGLGLDHCSSEEKALGQSRESGAAHYVGHYSSGSWPDKRDYHAYCTYPSKLARIIIEQGNAQMGRSYGHARGPQCDGFTAEELESLDFNTMDFSEFIADADEMANNANIADVDQLVNDMVEKIGHMQGSESRK